MGNIKLLLTMAVLTFISTFSAVGLIIYHYLDTNHTPDAGQVLLLIIITLAGSFGTWAYADLYYMAKEDQGLK